MHLFSGPIDIEARAQEALTAKPHAVSNRSQVAELNERVTKLESEVAELRSLLS